MTNVAGCSAGLVEDGCNGFVIPPRDSEKLSMAIDSILRKPELQRQMRTCSVERIQSYSPDACAAGLAAVAISLPGEPVELLEALAVDRWCRRLVPLTLFCELEFAIFWQHLFSGGDLGLGTPDRQPLEFRAALSRCVDCNICLRRHSGSASERWNHRPLGRFVCRGDRQFHHFVKIASQAFPHDASGRFFLRDRSFVSATVSPFIPMASLKAFSLTLLFLYCFGGARWPSTGGKRVFSRASSGESR